MTTYQMVLLLAFNHRDGPYTFAELFEMTQIPKDDLEQHLLSMAHPKVGIVEKFPRTRKTEDNHTFTLNAKFLSPQYRITVQLMKKETALVAEGGEGAQGEDGLSEDIYTQRKHQYVACLLD